jgi:hypothetical protein
VLAFDEVGIESGIIDSRIEKLTTFEIVVRSDLTKKNQLSVGF